MNKEKKMKNKMKQLRKIIDKKESKIKNKKWKLIALKLEYENNQVRKLKSSAMTLKTC